MAGVRDIEVDQLERSTMRVVGTRLIPFLMVCYFLSYLDRTNISIASLTMNEDLKLTAAQFGLGAGLFFVGYILFEIPSNLILHRVGARVWIARIMISWGIVAALMAAVQGPVSLYIVRIILGIAEAGFFPGIILYLTYWFPARYRGRAVGLFMSAVAISTALGAPVGGLLLKMDGIAGLDGWRWLFLLEGIPTVIVGVLVLWLLPSTPDKADWLTDNQRNWLTSTLNAEAAKTSARHHMSALQAIVKPRVLALSLIYFSTVFGLYGLGFWLPQIIKKSLGISDNLQVSLLTAVPYAIGVVAMILWGRVCDRTGRYAVGTAVPMLIGGGAMLASAFLVGLPWLGYVGLCVGALGVLMSFPGFWGLPGSFLTGAAAAAGIATINTIGNTSGFFGPYWVGWMKELFGSEQWGVVGIAVVMLIGAVCVVLLGNSPRGDTEEVRA